MQTPDPDDQAETPRPLRDEIAETLRATVRFPSGSDAGDAERATAQAADSIMHLLNERGHYLPGCPAASQILSDAQQFAGQLSLAMLVIRLLRILDTKIETPESKGTRRWLTEYIDGKNHGPVGRPMLWPGGLPGLAGMLREWGYQPTPTRPQFVARQPKSVVGHAALSVPPAVTLN